MNTRRTFAFLLVVTFALRALAQAPPDPRIPEALRGWESWALWKDDHRACPRPFNDPKSHACFWASRLELTAEAAGARFTLGVVAFHESWVPLPGGPELWPLNVQLDDAPAAVVERDGRPAVKVPPGTHRLAGSYTWRAIPQRLAVPAQIGVLSLMLDGAAVEAPVWDAEGQLWLKRDASTEETDKNFLSTKVYTALEDGIPLWLRTEIELTVSGKSREEEIGLVLPEGWKLASVESAIPVAIDEAGKMKAQVRAGKWTVRADAFRYDNVKEIRYAGPAAVAEQFIAFQANPELRVVEIMGAPSVDVSQMTFPEKWRALPVYRWETTSPIRIEERMRGMGAQKPAGLSIARQLWLDEDGRGLTFRDTITGAMQQIWRLDAAAGQELGSVRIGGQGQLLTRNPSTGATGVEIRTRALNLEATGRAARQRELPATGWQADAETVKVTLQLPPGWRLFALFGADWVRGDWLTAWTLLDLFLLLVFTLSVFRIGGLPAALLAFAAFALSYHELGAPRYSWLALLVPLALLRVMPEGRARRWIQALKFITLAALLLVLVPFVGRQVPQALYPQLENVSSGTFRTADMASVRAPENDMVTREFTVVSDLIGRGPGAGNEATRAGTEIAKQNAAKDWLISQGVTFGPNASAVYDARAGKLIVRNTPDQIDLIEPLFGSHESSRLGRLNVMQSVNSDNLQYDSKARIQTGPGVPEWTWRAVSFGWNGPVQAAQQVRPVLIPAWLERVLTALRVSLVLALAAALLRSRRTAAASAAGGGKVAPAAAALLLAFVSATPSATAADFPSNELLDNLRNRLLEAPDAFPHAADLPLVTLKLADRRVTLEAEVHAAVPVAVPMPGQLPAWSPLSVTVDDQPNAALRRDGGYLWVVVPAGVHRVKVDAMLSAATEWEFTYLLKPRRVQIEAPDWTTTGVRPDGVPEQQVFFVRKQKATTGAATYERQEVQSLVVVDRQLELGLVWQVRTVVTRLSPPGKAIALRIPLLPGENVLTANASVREGAIDVRLGAQDHSFTWESGLAVAPALSLEARASDTWVERWKLVASPVWNIAISGLAPVFEKDAAAPVTSNRTVAASGGDLIPTWQPWPGENVQLAVSRPEAIAGATVTVSRAQHSVSLGKRQRTSKLDLALRCSLGEDFLVELPADAEITSLTHSGKTIPVRKDGAKLVIPVHPGEQPVSIAWRQNQPLGARAQVEAVRLPVESANISTSLQVPDDRWVLWASGPQRGPAVLFWGILIVALLSALALGRVALSPLRTVEWMLLVIGLTQVPLPAALAVVAWLFFLAWRGHESFQRLPNLGYNFLQLALVGVTLIAIGILFTAVGEGLLGRPEMFIRGNGSGSNLLRWFQARAESTLPQPACVSVSIWWYRLLMLLWALWLAAALIRWLRIGWENFARGGFFHRAPKAATPPPPLPTN